MKGLDFKRWGVGGAFIGALALGSCSGMMTSEQVWTMATSDKLPSATGKVKVKEEKDGNTRVKVEVAHLAQPDAAFNRATTYVVWLKPRTGLAQNVGVLNVDKKLNGSLETRTPFKDFTVLVTAEREANVTMPTGQSVMDTKVVVPT